ncbi:hypothetical protein SKAU_G00309350 [Synaphobranchus kaupii]|uniref:Uncharacterized protein n=1 Tax=Synaphobranchus kaupii TaxID=118154 RepID=A0A9Q1ERB3_SYNKA|nr:hypothetical protein SKAU_G00309350 [Synaphobranchus kaupii]
MLPHPGLTCLMNLKRVFPGTDGRGKTVATCDSNHICTAVNSASWLTTAERHGHTAWAPFCPDCTETRLPGELDISGARRVYLKRRKETR